MLVLARKTQQQIHIGDNIVVTILQVKGQTIRIGIEAPTEVRVRRSELPEQSYAATGASESSEQAAAAKVTKTVKPVRQPMTVKAIRDLRAPLADRLVHRRLEDGMLRPRGQSTETDSVRRALNADPTPVNRFSGQLGPQSLFHAIAQTSKPE